MTPDELASIEAYATPALTDLEGGTLKVCAALRQAWKERDEARSLSAENCALLEQVEEAVSFDEAPDDFAMSFPVIRKAYEVRYSRNLYREELRLANEANLVAIAALDAAAKSLRSACRMLKEGEDRLNTNLYLHNRAFVAEDALKSLKEKIGEGND